MLQRQGAIELRGDRQVKWGKSQGIQTVIPIIYPFDKDYLLSLLISRNTFLENTRVLSRVNESLKANRTSLLNMLG